MNNVEMELKDLILKRYGSLSEFCKKIGIPWTTLDSILKRGVEKANIKNILKITTELGIDVESLAAGEIVSSSSTVAAHHEGDDYTPEEWEEIEKFKMFVKSKRSQ